MVSRHRDLRGAARRRAGRRCRGNARFPDAVSCATASAAPALELVLPTLSRAGRRDYRESATGQLLRGSAVACTGPGWLQVLTGGGGMGLAGSDGSGDDARWRVFISHTSELRDFPKGTSYVAAVERAISAAGHVIVDMADFAAADQAPAQVCAERVRGCEVYVGVLGTRYGSPVRDRPEVSYTELEFDTATEAGLDRLVFLLDTDADDVGIPPSALIDSRVRGPPGRVPPPGAGQRADHAVVREPGRAQAAGGTTRCGTWPTRARRIGSGIQREQVPAEPQPVRASKFVNPPPATAPAWFQDRQVETGLLAGYVTDPGIRLVTVAGRGGIGKTAMVCRLLKGLEAGRIPDVEGDFAAITVGGIVYLSRNGAHQVEYPTLVADLLRLLPADAAQRLQRLYQDPHHTPRGDDAGPAGGLPGRGAGGGAAGQPGIGDGRRAGNPDRAGAARGAERGADRARARGHRDRHHPGDAGRAAEGRACRAAPAAAGGGPGLPGRRDRPAGTRRRRPPRAARRPRGAAGRAAPAHPRVPAGAGGGQGDPGRRWHPHPARPAGPHPPPARRPGGPGAGRGGLRPAGRARAAGHAGPGRLPRAGLGGRGRLPAPAGQPHHRRRAHLDPAGPPPAGALPGRALLPAPGGPGLRAQPAPSRQPR